MKFFIASRDIASANATSAIARSLKRLGHTLFVLTEGKATSVFSGWGIIPDIALPEDRLLCSVDLNRVFDQHNFDAVITGLSTPINYETTVALMANRRYVPYIAVADASGADCRIHGDVDPAIIITPDENGARLAHQRFQECPIVVSGHIGVTKTEVTEAKLQKFSEVCEQDVTAILFTDFGEPGDPAIYEQMELLAECIARSKKQVIVLPSFHPKHKSLHSEWGMQLMEVLPFNAEVWFDTGLSTNVLATLAHITVSGSSPLFTAALAGKVAIVLDTPGTRGYRERTLSTTEPPLVGIGCATLVDHPIDLLQCTAPTAEAVAKLKPFDAEVVCKAIEALVAERR